MCLSAKNYYSTFSEFVKRYFINFKYISNKIYYLARIKKFFESA